MLQVRRENSSWMATGALAWALRRCGGSAGCRVAAGQGGGGKQVWTTYLTEPLGQLLHQGFHGAAHAQQQGRAGELLVCLPAWGVVPQGEVLVVPGHQLVCELRWGQGGPGSMARLPCQPSPLLPTPYRMVSGVCRRSPPTS